MIDIRRAEPSDAPVVAEHRAAMFTDMGVLHPSVRGDVVRMTLEYLREAMVTGEYVGWLAAPEDDPGKVVGGAGVQVRRVLPFPVRGAATPRVAVGRQGIVLNVYTEPPHRRCGIARLLMRSVLAWADESGLESLVLHASDAGRRVYEQLGFVATNEMRFAGLPSPGER